MFIDPERLLSASEFSKLFIFLSSIKSLLELSPEGGIYSECLFDPLSLVTLPANILIGGLVELALCANKSGLSSVKLLIWI
jgi:hypothetical protein